VLRSGHNLYASRFWNLISQNRDASVHLEHIAAVVESFPLSGDKIPRHSQFTHQICLYRHEYSTLVHQAHKCDSETCNDVYLLPMDALNDVYADSDLHSWKQSAWSIHPHRLCGSSEGYIAISHVRSDGTAVVANGVWRVNKCLFDFFPGVASEGIVREF
jgi:hypothetical protein